MDENRRSALHFAAAMNKVALVERLLAAEAEVDLADKEGEYMQCMSSRQEQQAGAGAVRVAMWQGAEAGGSLPS